MPSCLQDRSKASILLKNISVDAESENLLAELCEAIIPATDTPGAKDISAHLFVLQMMDDCYSPEDQEAFVNGLKNFEKKSQKLPGGSFLKSDPENRAKLLRELEVEKEKAEPVNRFYSMVKRLTIQAYTTSEYFLTRIQRYELIPGRWVGCVNA